MPLLALPILIVLAFIVLIPVSIIQRFRMGTARRQARKWVATLNLSAVALSIVLFLVGTLITSRWIPEARAYTLYGLAGGCVLGMIGTALTRWEYAGARLQYTPNRWLVLGITLVVTVRVLYGFWRGWEASRAGLTGAEWVATSGVAGSMSAGAVVLGYYLLFWAGVRRRISRHQRA